MADHSEPRFSVDLPIRVFGIDADGHAFSQIAHTRNLSEHGARLVGLEERLSPGDIIGVHFGDKKSRCTVIWVVSAPDGHALDAGVKLSEGQPHPWQAEMEKRQAKAIARVAPGRKERRKFPRQPIPFQIEVRDGQYGDAPMRTRTADIAGSGCYIETLLPLPAGKTLMVTFWLDGESVHTSAIVRTCDRGVGMGIEFTGLDQAAQKKLQRQVESIAVESAEIAAGAEMTDVWMRR
jgi:hypothetical protein